MLAIMLEMQGDKVLLTFARSGLSLEKGTRRYGSPPPAPGSHCHLLWWKVQPLVVRGWQEAQPWRHEGVAVPLVGLRMVVEGAEGRCGRPMQQGWRLWQRGEERWP